MELESNYFRLRMQESCVHIPEPELDEMITELSSNAMFFMDSRQEAETSRRMVVAIVDMLRNSKYRFLQISLVCQAFAQGSVGELGGTTKFTVRNVAIWLNAMLEKQQVLRASQQTKKDDEIRAVNEQDFRKEQKRNNLFGKAFLLKMEWCYNGTINRFSDEDYDGISLDKIVHFLEKGISVDQITPEMIFSL
jgi:hypothetical protein